MDENSTHKKQAVVIGASISGLLTARVLARHFAHVTVVERDFLPKIGQPSSEPRKGVPQGRHLHVLLAHGVDVLEAFFPGLTKELQARGANIGDLSESVRWFSDGAYTRNFHSGLVGVQVSRPLLESTILQRVNALPNVTILDNHAASGLLTTSSMVGDEKQVTGLTVVDRSKSEPIEQRLPSDLLVDAGGRGTRSLAWLESIGYPVPEEELIKIDLTYTTRIFKRLPEHAQGRSPIIIVPGKKCRRGAAMLAVEGDRWIVGLSGMLGDAAPPDLPGFIEYARSLDAPDCYEIIKNAEPAGEASQYKFPVSQRRHFEKVSHFPEGFLLIGDALCSFNPIYGQGMTTAASEAAVLDEMLHSASDTLPPRFARRFFHRASSLLDSPWSIAAGSDLAYPEVEGKRAPGMGLVQSYLDRLLRVSSEDSEVNLAFQKVTNLIAPPPSLFHPRIVLRVLRSRLS
jgi:2-polyprenyl-6-methoxyphenol hydroxylase-like FAD-dependent oxidoreductase